MASNVSNTNLPVATNPPLRFSARQDILLLRETVATNFDFDDIATKLSKILGRPIARRTAKERIDRLLKQFKAEDTANLRKSGTEEEYTEKEVLLQELVEMEMVIVAGSTSASTQKKSKETAKEISGEEIRKRALEGMKDRSVTPKKMKMKAMDEFLASLKIQKDKELDLEKKRLELKEKELEMLKKEREDDREERKLIMLQLLSKLNKQ